MKRKATSWRHGSWRGIPIDMSFEDKALAAALTVFVTILIIIAGVVA
jgi:hypothetical protein